MSDLSRVQQYLRKWKQTFLENTYAYGHLNKYCNNNKDNADWILDLHWSKEH